MLHRLDLPIVVKVLAPCSVVLLVSLSLAVIGLRHMNELDTGAGYVGWRFVPAAIQLKAVPLAGKIGQQEHDDDAPWSKGHLASRIIGTPAQNRRLSDTAHSGL